MVPSGRTAGEMLERGVAARDVLRDCRQGRLAPVPARAELWVDAEATVEEFYDAWTAGLVEGKLSAFGLIQMGADVGHLLLFAKRGVLSELPTFYEWHQAEATLDQLLAFMRQGLVLGKTDPYWLWFAGADVAQVIDACDRGLLAPIGVQDLVDRRAPFAFVERAAAVGMLDRPPTVGQLLAAYGRDPDVSAICERVLRGVERGLVALGDEAEARALAEHVVRSRAWETRGGTCVVCLDETECLAVCKGPEGRHGHLVCPGCAPATLASSLALNGRISCPLCRAGL